MMKLDLTEAEVSVLFTALDVAVKTLGAQAVIPLAPILQKIEAAAKAATEEE